MVPDDEEAAEEAEAVKQLGPAKWRSEEAIGDRPSTRPTVVFVCVCFFLTAVFQNTGVFWFGRSTERDGTPMCAGYLTFSYYGPVWCSFMSSFTSSFTTSIAKQPIL
jgi:hypothetical protein